MHVEHRHPGVRIYDRPGRLAQLWRGRPVTLAMLALIAGMMAVYIFYGP